jgi:type IV secretory pathway VirB3-like protein
MVNLFKQINKKINGVAWSFVATGIILILLAILIAWTDFILRLIVALFVLLVAYTLIFAGYKLWSVKTEIEKHFKI